MPRSALAYNESSIAHKPATGHGNTHDCTGVFALLEGFVAGDVERKERRVEAYRCSRQEGRARPSGAVARPMRLGFLRVGRP